MRFEHATTIALDPDARSVTLAALDLATGETRSGRLADCPSTELIVEWAKWATEPLGSVYESGLCGFQHAREVRAMEICCDIIAVTSMPRSTEDKRLKDDRRDAPYWMAKLFAVPEGVQDDVVLSGRAWVDETTFRRWRASSGTALTES